MANVERCEDYLGLQKRVKEGGAAVLSSQMCAQRPFANPDLRTALVPGCLLWPEPLGAPGVPWKGLGETGQALEARAQPVWPTPSPLAFLPEAAGVPGLRDA